MILLYKQDSWFLFGISTTKFSVLHLVLKIQLVLYKLNQMERETLHKNQKIFEHSSDMLDKNHNTNADDEDRF